MITSILELTDGKWKPGTVSGEPIEMEKEVAVQFCLYPFEEIVKMAKESMQKGNKLLFESGKPKKP